MRLKPSTISFAIFATIQLSIWVPINAAAYDVSDVALTPGQDITQLNIAWQHSNKECNCVVEIAEKSDKNKKEDGKGIEFPEDSREFYGTNEFAGLDENSVPTYACEVTVSGLENLKNYVYRLGNDGDEWSNTYEYATRDKNRYGFFYLADSQIGASGPTYFLKNESVKKYISEYYIRKTLPSLSDEEVKDLIDAYANNALSKRFPEHAAIAEAIDLLYDTFYEDTTDRLEKLAEVEENMTPGNSEVTERIYTLQTAAAEQDSRGWAETVKKMTEKFPEAAFILSGGDQVELTNREYEYTGFFSPPELTSLPVAPAVGNHERAVNFDYHFNLPNESSEYGVNQAAGDYYFSYGDALFMVLNMDTTISAFPKEPPPDPPGGGAGGSSNSPPTPPGQGTGGASNPPPTPPGQGTGGSSNSPPTPPGQGTGGSSNPPPAPPGQGTGGASNPPPSKPGEDGPIDTEEEFEVELAELENYCDDETGECYDKIETFKKSIAEHSMFLKETITANPNAKWKIVMWHYSIYSAGNHAVDDEIRALKHYLVPVLDELDIDLVLMAHDHCFTRTYQMLGEDPQPEQKVDQKGRVVNPTGILYLTANSSSGSKYYGLNSSYNVTDNPNTPEIEGPDPYFEYVAVAGQLRAPLFSYIVVDQDSLELSTYRTDTMEMIDSYAIVKE